MPILSAFAGISARGYGFAGALPPNKYNVFAVYRTTPYIAAWKFAEGYGTKYSDPATGLGSIGDGIDVVSTGTAVVATHRSSPYVSTYPFSASGFGTKYANPSVLPTTDGYGPSFLPNGSAVILPLRNSSPYIVAYAWSAGFGTKYSNPSTLPTAGLYQIAASDSVIWSAPLNAWAWSSGFGTKYANPATYPGGLGVCYSADKSVVAVAQESSPYVSAYAWSGGFGTKYADPSTAVTTVGYARGVAFNPTKTAISVSLLDSVNYTYSICAYAWSGGFGTKYANPATLPAYTGYNTRFTDDGKNVGYGDDNAAPFIYPWSNGYGTKYAAPATNIPSNANAMAFGI